MDEDERVVVVSTRGLTSFVVEMEDVIAGAAEGRGGRPEGAVVVASLEAEDPGKRDAKVNPLVVVGTALLVDEEGRDVAATAAGSELDLATKGDPFISFPCDAPVVGLGGRPLGFDGALGFGWVGLRVDEVPLELARGRGGKVAGDEAKRELAATFSVRA